MLFILTGDIQIGKTRWLTSLANELESQGARCAGVIAPGVWVPSDTGDANGFEKLGIDNVLLPEKKRIPFARRRDLALAEGTLDPESQSAQMKLGWEISDDAIAQVNRHFDNIARTVREGGDRTTAADPAKGNPGLLIVDEFGRLELLRNLGLASALALIDAGPTQAFPHALIVVRDTLLQVATERFSPAWDDVRPISPTPKARKDIRRALGIEG